MSGCFGGEVLDPLFQLRFVSVGPRVGHAADDVDLHLPGVIERTPDLHSFGLFRANPLAKIKKIGTPHGKRGAGQHRRGFLAEQKLPQLAGQIDGRDMRGGELVAASGQRSPVNTLVRLLLGKNRNAFDEGLQTLRNLRRFRPHILPGIRGVLFQNLTHLLQAADDFDRQLQLGAHPHLAAFGEVAGIGQRGKKTFTFVDRRSHHRGTRL